MRLLKTVFLLDRSPYVVNTIAKTFEVEVFKAEEGTEQKTFQVARTIWSCAVEAVLEYRRIVRDLFVQTSHLCFVASDRPCRVIGETWSEEAEQTQLLHQLAKLSKGDSSSWDASQFADALSTVVDILCRASPQQLESIREGKTTSNDCRLIAITHIEKFSIPTLFRSSTARFYSKEDLLAFFQRVRDEVNKKNVSGSPDSVANTLPVASLATCIINVCPEKGPETELSSIEGIQVDAPFEVKPHSRAQYVRHTDHSELPFVFELYNPRSMDQLLADIYLLVQKHHQLGSTTVCNIPMKEEQQYAGGKSSKTYDVELVHPIEAFADLWQWGLADDEAFRERNQSTATYKTLRLFWGSPLGTPNVEFQNMTTRAVRCTPVQLNSRESICLTSFILGGRAISLELQVPEQGKRMTHMMQCHGKVIYMHSVALGTSTIPELLPVQRGAVPSSSGYRVEDFVHFCKTAALTPAGSHSGARCSKENGTLNERQMELKRRTNFWPLSTNDSSIFANHIFFDPILSIAKTGDFTDRQLADCHKLISLVNSSYERKEDTQWIRCTNWKSLSIEELYGRTWSDLEQYTLNYVQVSKNHAQLHGSIAACARSATNAKEEKTELKARVIETDHIAATNGATRQSVNGLPKRMKEMTSFESLGGQTLLKYWDKNLYMPRWNKWRDFEARTQATSDRVKLYVDVLSKVEEEMKRGDTYALTERVNRR